MSDDRTEDGALVVLERAAQEFADATAWPPLVHDLSPEAVSD